MKQLLIFGMFICLYSCKKDHSLNLEKSDATSLEFKDNQSNQYSARVNSSGLSLNSYGFLKFNSANDYTKFIESLKTSTNGEIKMVLNNLNFISIGSINISSIENDKIIKESQYEEYLFNNSGFIQIGNVILRKKSNGEFVLTCNSNNFSSNVYNDMLSDNYVPNVMNQFAINVSRANDFDIIKYCENSPNGLVETSNPSAYFGKRKVFGWGTVHSQSPAPGMGAGYCWDTECERYFAFGIGVSHLYNCHDTLIMCTAP